MAETRHKPRSPIESGCPDGFKNRHPVMRKHYGNWDYHEDPQPGVLKHVAYGRDAVYTVKAAAQRILDVYTLRKLCDIGDTYADGHVHFTMRGNLECFVTEQSRVRPLVDALTDAGFVVGSAKNSVTRMSHTQGWLHCDIPGIDAEHAKLAIWVGGNHSNARGKPSFQKLVAAGIPNNSPRWPEATAIVKKILHTYKDDARDWGRINDWIDRIGWTRFFELTGLPFTKFHIDNWRGARNSLNASAHIRF